MNWLIQAGVFIGAALVNYLMRSEVKNPKPDKFDITSGSGRNIPIVWGTCKVSPNIFWYGDAKSTVFTREGNFAGYTYYICFAAGVCWGPIDALVDMLFNEGTSIQTLDFYGDLYGQQPGYSVSVDPDLPVGLTGNEVGIDLRFDARALFGGSINEGGIKGLTSFYFGTEAQVKNTYLDAQISALTPGTTTDTTPAYKRLCYIVFKRDPTYGTGGGGPPNGQFYWGVTPNVKPFGMVVRRCPSALNGTTTSQVGAAASPPNYPRGYDANAAEMLYEIYTDQWWGLKKTAADMDVPSFQACAETLYAQGLGISLQVDSSTPAEDVIRDIERHVDAVVYTSSKTGLITMVLLRGDYNIDELPEINFDNSRELEFHRPTYQSLPTGVKVKWTNPEKSYQEDVAEWQNQALVDITGEESTEDVALPGLTRSNLASDAAYYIGRSITRSIPVAQFKMNRLGFDFHKGTPFVLSYPEMNIGPLIMRVIEIDYGSLEDGEIGISAVQDTNTTQVIPWQDVGYPTAAPPTPTLAQTATSRATASWTGANPSLQISVTWQKSSNGTTGWANNQVWMSPAGATSQGVVGLPYSTLVPLVGVYYRVFLQYYNSGGYGPASPVSNVVHMVYI